MHKLLLRQLKRLKQKGTEHIDFTDEAWDQFLNSISDSYEQADKDKEMIERSLKLASDELTQRNRDLRKSIKELNHNQELIKFQANHDALTKLPNRSFFMSQVEQSLIGVDSNNQLAIFLLI